MVSYSDRSLMSRIGGLVRDSGAITRPYVSNRRALAGVLASSAIGSAIHGSSQAYPSAQRQRSGSMMSTSNYSVSGNGGGVTNQLDRDVQYVAPRRGSSKKKLIKKSAVQIALNGLAPQCMLRNSSLTGVTSSPTTQQVIGISLYGGKGEVDATLGDLGSTDLNSLFASNAASNSEMYYFTHGRLDCTIRNVTEEFTEYDIYEYRWRGDTVNTPGLFTFFATAASDQINVGTTALTMQTRGATPFQFPLVTKNLQILKKTKYLIQGGQAFTYQMSDPRKHKIYVNDITRDTDLLSFPVKGITTGIIVVMKSQIGNINNQNSTLAATRTYTFKKLQLNRVGAAAF